MEYVLFFEVSPEDLEKVIEKQKEITGLREEFPDKYGEVLSVYNYAGEAGSGFALFRGTHEQMQNAIIHYAPEVTFVARPIIEFSKTVEILLARKK